MAIPSSQDLPYSPFSECAADPPATSPLPSPHNKKLQPVAPSDAAVAILRSKQFQITETETRIVVALDPKTTNMEFSWAIYKGSKRVAGWTIAKLFPGRVSDADHVPGEVVYRLNSSESDGLEELVASGWVGRLSLYDDKDQYRRILSLKMAVNGKYKSWADKSVKQELAQKALKYFIEEQIITTVKREAEKILKEGESIPEVWHIVMAIPASWPLDQQEAFRGLVSQGVVGVDGQKLVVTVFEEASCAAFGILPQLIKENKLPNLGEGGSILVADCGGGTSDLAALKVKITPSGPDGVHASIDDSEEWMQYLKDCSATAATGSIVGANLVSRRVLARKQTLFQKLNPKEKRSVEDYLTSPEVPQILSQITSFKDIEKDKSSQDFYGGDRAWVQKLKLTKSDFVSALKLFVQNDLRTELWKMLSRLVSRLDGGMKPAYLLFNGRVTENPLVREKLKEYFKSYKVIFGPPERRFDVVKGLERRYHLYCQDKDTFHEIAMQDFGIGGWGLFKEETKIDGESVPWHHSDHIEQEDDDEYLTPSERRKLRKRKRDDKGNTNMTNLLAREVYWLQDASYPLKPRATPMQQRFPCDNTLQSEEYRVITALYSNMPDFKPNKLFVDLDDGDPMWSISPLREDILEVGEVTFSITTRGFLDSDGKPKQPLDEGSRKPAYGIFNFWYIILPICQEQRLSVLYHPSGEYKQIEDLIRDEEAIHTSPVSVALTGHERLPRFTKVARPRKKRQ